MAEWPTLLFLTAQATPTPNGKAHYVHQRLLLLRTYQHHNPLFPPLRTSAMTINVCCSPPSSPTTFLQFSSSPVSRLISPSRRPTVSERHQLEDERSGVEFLEQRMEDLFARFSASVRVDLATELSEKFEERIRQIEGKSEAKRPAEVEENLRSDETAGREDLNSSDSVQSQLRFATYDRRCRRRLSFRGLDGLGSCGVTVRIGKGRRSGRLEVSCGVTVIDQSRFKEEVLNSDKPVLVDFVADWCGPCRLIAPIVDWISEEYKDRLKVVKIDHDASRQLIETYKVYGLPTLIIFKDGREVPESRREGAITKIKLKKFLDSFLEKMVVS